MTQPYAPQQPGYPAQPAPQWPSQAPAAPQQPYPQQAYVPQQGYAPPQPYAQPYPAQGYPQQAPPQQPVQLAAGSLDAFYAQPSSGGGPGLKFPEVGSAHVMVVNRPLQDSDVQQQTDTHGKPQTYRDGRPKFVLKVPVNVPRQPNHDDGKGQWFCQGSARDDLSRAMQMVGGPEGAPEFGAFIYVAKTGKRPIPGGNSANVWDVRYTRPGPEAQALAAQYGIEYPDLNGAAATQPAQPAAPVAPAPAPQAPPPAAPPAPAVQAPAAPAPQAPPPAAPPAPPAPAAPQVPPPAAPAASAPPAPPAAGDTNGLPQDKAALLAQLTGGAPAAG